MLQALKKFYRTVCNELRRFASNPERPFKVSLAALLLAVLFISVKINCVAYIVLVTLITLTLWSCFSFRKNIGFYLYYAWILLLSEVALYAQKGLSLPLWVATIMFLVICCLLLSVGWCLYCSKASGSLNEDVGFENLFPERKQDLERLVRYLKDFKVIGINSFWGNGKTCLYEMFKKQNEESYYFISISVMTLKLDSVERFLVSEISRILGQNKIYSAASAKLSVFLDGDAFRGFGRFFTANSSYTEAFQTLMLDINKLDRPLFITFEDIDRVSKPEIVSKVFAISEMLTRWTTRIRILFQYDRLALSRIFKDAHESYLEKYIPYTIDLTPISFRRCLKVLLKSESENDRVNNIKDGDFSIVTSEAHIGQWLGAAGIHGINNVVSLDLKWYSIRSIDLYIKEVDALMAEETSYDKNVVVLLMFAKHFLSGEIFNVTLSEGFSENAIFTLDDAACNIQQVLVKLRAIDSDEKRAEEFRRVFSEGSANLYYLLLMNKLGYKLSKIVESRKAADLDERASNILNEDPASIRDRDSNEKLDRLVRRIYAKGRSDRTNLENAVAELEKVLDLDGEQRDSAFSEFLNNSYYESFERIDNRTIFLLGISSFVSIFQGFHLYEKNDKYWLRLLDLYFKSRKVAEISAELIQCLNYCCIDQREVFLDVIRRFNSLGTKGNLNKTKSYVLFLRKYIQKIITSTGIRGDYWGYLMSNGFSGDEVIKQFKNAAVDMKTELEKLREGTAFDVIKDDCVAMCSFLDKNIELIQSKSALKEYEDNISFHTEIYNPIRDIEERINHNKLKGDKLDEFLEDSYRKGNLKATEVQRLRKEYGGNVHQ